MAQISDLLFPKGHKAEGEEQINEEIIKQLNIFSGLKEFFPFSSLPGRVSWEENPKKIRIWPKMAKAAQGKEGPEPGEGFGGKKGNFGEREKILGWDRKGLGRNEIFRGGLRDLGEI